MEFFEFTGCGVQTGTHLHMVHLEHGEELVKAGTQHGDGGGLYHQATARGGAVEPPQQGVVRAVSRLRHCRGESRGPPPSHYRMTDTHSKQGLC